MWKFHHRHDLDRRFAIDFFRTKNTDFFPGLRTFKLRKNQKCEFVDNFKLLLLYKILLPKFGNHIVCNGYEMQICSEN